MLALVVAVAVVALDDNILATPRIIALPSMFADTDDDEPECIAGEVRWNDGAMEICFEDEVDGWEWTRLHEEI